MHLDILYEDFKKAFLKNVPNNPHVNKIKNWGVPGDFYLDM